MLKFLKIILFKICWQVALVSVLVSCVGTIEDKNAETTKISSPQVVPLSFIGIDRAIPIATDKVEVYFFPASGEKEDLTYLISYDGLANPITASAVFLELDYRGLHRYTIVGLSADTNYTFDLQVKNNKTAEISSTKEARTAKTFSNVTADFAGIAVANNIAGVDGMTAVRIEWPEAYRVHPSLPATEKDVIEYEVTLVNANAGSPADFDSTVIVEPNKKVYPVPVNVVSYIANGLLPGTEYFVRVRAIHFGSTQNSLDPSYLNESNNKYEKVKTLSADLADLEFNQSEATLAMAPGVAGQSALRVTWGEVAGAFDHFRLYYTETGNLNLEASYVQDDCDRLRTYGLVFRCKKVDFNLNESTISDLIPQKTYSVRVMLCQDSACSNGKRISFNDISADTDPPLAIFGGITGAGSARDSNALDQIFLLMDPPKLSTGVIDGIAVKVFQNIDLGIVSDAYLNLPDINGDGVIDEVNDVVSLSGASGSPVGGLSALGFDFKVAEEVAVSGINPFSSGVYTFMLVPYVFSGGLVKLDESNVTPFDLSPAIEAPTAFEFPGVTSVTCDVATQTARVRWNLPTVGVYSNFKIYWSKSGGFDFGAAKSGAAGYEEALMSKTSEEFSIPFLAAGAYRIGVLSYLSAGVGFYSENNQSISLINIPGDCN